MIRECCGGPEAPIVVRLLDSWEPEGFSATVDQCSACGGWWVAAGPIGSEDDACAAAEVVARFAAALAGGLPSGRSESREERPGKETGCASAHESCGGLPAGPESDTEDTEPGGAP